MKLTRYQVAALDWAVSEAEAWRGSLVGNPDTRPLVAFDRKVGIARSALQKIKDAYAEGEFDE